MMLFYFYFIVGGGEGCLKKGFFEFLFKIYFDGGGGSV
jgi:hypothetical protein